MGESLKYQFPEIVMPQTGRPYRETVQPKQAAFHNSDAEYRLASGAYGGGKSAMVVIEIIKECWMYPNNYGYILRQSFRKLRSSIMKDFFDIVPKWMIVQSHYTEHWVDLLNHVGVEYLRDNGIKKINRKTREKIREIGGLSRVEFHSYENNVEAEDQFTSSNIGWFMIEQAEEASYEIYKYLIGRRRRQPASGRVLLVANPDGHDWLWDIFSPESDGKLEGHEWHIFETSDNPFLPDHYEAGMELTYSEDEKQRLLHGSYDVAIDAVYPELSRSMHLIPYFEPPESWQKAIGIDHGLENPTAAVWIAEDPATEDLFVYHEYLEPKKIVPQHAGYFLTTLTKQHRCRVIDPTTVNKQGTDRNSVILEYNRHGLALAPSSRDKPAGLLRIKEYLQIDPERMHRFTGLKGAPRLYIMSNCKQLWKQMGRYRWEKPKSGMGDENKMEKTLKKDDHLPDALRYVMVAFANALTKHSVVKDIRPPERWRRHDIKTNPYLTVDKDTKEWRMTISKDITAALKEPKIADNRTTWMSA